MTKDEKKADRKLELEAEMGRIVIESGRLNARMRQLQQRANAIEAELNKE